MNINKKSEEMHMKRKVIQFMILAIYFLSPCTHCLHLAKRAKFQYRSSCFYRHPQLHLAIIRTDNGRKTQIHRKILQPG